MLKTPTVLLALAAMGCRTGCHNQSPRRSDAALPKVAPVYGPTNPTPEQMAQEPVKYYASIVELKPEMEKKYRELHADVWKEVVAAIKKANIRNFNIFVTDIAGKRYLISTLEYTGQDAEKDFGSMKDDAVTRDKWWPITDNCQRRLPGTPEGEQWRAMEMLMHIK